MHLALANAQAQVQRSLDEIFAPLPHERIVNWHPWFWAYGLIVLLALLLMPIIYRMHRHALSYRGREVAAAMLFVTPWVVGFVVFVGGPIFFSILIAFTRYDVLSPAHWVAWDNFRLILQDNLFYKSLGNTAFMILRVPLTMATSLALAMLLNHAVRGVSFYRTAYYMPAIVPAVASSLLWVWVLNPESGNPKSGPAVDLSNRAFSMAARRCRSLVHRAPLASGCALVQAFIGFDEPVEFWRRESSFGSPVSNPFRSNYTKPPRLMARARGNDSGISPSPCSRHTSSSISSSA